MGCVGGDLHPAPLFAPLFSLQSRFIGANSASTTASGSQHLFFSPFPWTALPRELFLQLAICQISLLALRWSGSKPQQYPLRHGGYLFWPCSIPTDAAFARGKLRRYFQSTKKRKRQVSRPGLPLHRGKCRDLSITGISVSRVKKFIDSQCWWEGPSVGLWSNVSPRAGIPQR